MGSRGVQTGEALGSEGCGAVGGRRGEGAEAPSKGLSWTCRLWPLDSVDFSPPSLSESCSGSSAAAGTSDAEVAEWPQAAGCG
jgi:hypothetical protein